MSASTVSNPNLKIRRTDMPNECESVTKLRADFNAHVESVKERELRQDMTHEKNMEAISKLTEATQGVVDAWHTASGLQKFVKWLSGFTFLGIIVFWLTGNNPFK